MRKSCGRNHPKESFDDEKSCAEGFDVIIFFFDGDSKPKFSNKQKLTKFLLKICKMSLRHVEILFWSDNLLPVLFVWNFVELFGVNKANILIYESPTSWWLSRRAQKYGESSSSSWVYVSLLTFKGLIRPSLYLCVQTPKAIDFLCDGLTRVYFWFFRARLKSAALAFDFSQGWWLGNCFVPNLSRTHWKSR